jgi:hypothetical protein
MPGTFCGVRDVPICATKPQLVCQSFFIAVTVPERDNFKGRIHFGSKFQRFQSKVVWLPGLSPEARQSSMAAGAWGGWRRLFLSRWLRRKRRQKGAKGKISPSQSCPSDLLSPVMPHF